MSKISVVVPCYNEQESLPFFWKEISKVANSMSDIEFEFLFVNDGSNDGTLNALKKLSMEDKRIKYLSFSRNFGKESAIYAGLKYSSGDYVSIMDADLQDPPELLEEMLVSIRDEDYDCVATRRISRDGEPKIRSFFARMFYKIINKISKTEIVDGARDFRLMTRQMVNSILEVREYNRFSKGIFGWVGYETKWIEYKNIERVAGETKWSFWKLFLYSIEGIVAFSTVPLAISSIVGFLFFIISIIMIVLIVIKTIMFGDPVQGWPSLACIIFLVGGMQLFCMGILGEYLSRTYLEVKDRPIFIIKESVGIRLE